VSYREGRSKAFVFYFLGDWFDGSVFEGWR